MTTFRSRHRAARWGAALLVLALVAGACSDSGDDPDRESPPTSAPPDGGPTSVADLGAGPLAVRLRTGAPVDAQVTDPVAVVAGQPLDRDEVAAVLDRLPEWDTPDDDQQDFNRPAETLRPPRNGDTIEAPFPAQDDDPPPPVPPGPLEVLRYQPEGDVDLAPFISVTFNQPMVELGTVDQVEAADVPVTVTPDLPGRWEWIGTKTLRFEHQSDLIDRLPMATSYVVDIPAGTNSTTGGQLADAVRFEFSTPTVQLRSFQPEGDSLPLEPVFVASFDQRIDPAAMLSAITVEAGDQPVDVRLATDNEIEADEQAARAVDRALEDRWIAFRPVDPLPADIEITARIGPGAPSAEGPRTSEDTPSRTLRTFAPLRVEEQNCTESEPCEPSQQLRVQLNNPLDEAAFDPAQVTIEPALDASFVFVAGDTLTVAGATAANTTYEVTVDAGLTDIHGQTLAGDEKLKFTFGEARPRLDPFAGELITLDPFDDSPSIAVTSVNHQSLRVRLFSVDPTDWFRYRQYAEDWYRGELQTTIPTPPWPATIDREVALDEPFDQLTQTDLELSDVLGDDPGHVVMIVEPTGDLARLDRNDPDFWSNRPTMTWIQRTDIGLDAFADREDLVAWTTDLASGAPKADVEVTLTGTDQTQRTDADGLGQLALPAANRPNDGPLVARHQNDSAILAGGWSAETTRDVTSWHLFSDRGLYKPGETAHFKGWVRGLRLSGDAQLALVEPGTRAEYRIQDPQGNELATGELDLSPLGGFDFSIDVPDGANLGPAEIRLRLIDSSFAEWHYDSFEIQDFRRPEFEVTARTESPAPYFVDQPATVAVDATYFSGGPLPDADVEWVVTTDTTSYTPPNWPDYTFGIWTPWWESGYGGYDDYSAGFAVEDYDYPYPDGEPVAVETLTGRTGPDGTHYLEMSFTGDGENQPTSVTAQATVFDVNRQAWSSTAAVLVHPADVYVGLRSPRAFVRQGEPLLIDAIVTDLDGEAVAGRTVTMEASRLEWRYQNGEWSEVAVDTETCSVTSAAEAVSCSFATGQGGTYEVSATVTDTTGRRNRSELTRWVSGGTARPDARVQQEVVTLIPDQAEYEAGETAEILVQSPFGPADGLVNIMRNGFVSTSRFEATDGSAVVEIPITDDLIPGVRVQIDLVGQTDRIDADGQPVTDVPPRPAYATGAVELAVPATTRSLTVTATPTQPEVEPGAATTVDVSVVDARGEPVDAAEVALVVVDEAVLALSGYQLPDPNEAFYLPRGADWIDARYGRASIELTGVDRFQEVSEALSGDGGTDAASGGEASFDAAATTIARLAAPAELAPSANQGQGGSPTTPIDVRTEFDALALFAPDERTGADGTLTVEVDLPDSLTRYRVMAVAVGDTDSFGSGEATITARLPIMVRPSAPRFLNFGDRFELPVIVQNQTDQPLDVDVAVQTTNLTLSADDGRRVTVPANDRVEVRFDAEADAAGTARFRVAAAGGSHADAAAGEMPVYTPATTEAFATYGVVDAGSVIQPLLAPTGVIEQFGGLEVDTSSTALQALTDAVLYLHDYRYESSDGLASRIMAVAALRDVLDAFSAEGLPPPAELDAAVADDIAALSALQNGDGGFPYWRRGEDSIPYNSIQAVHTLVAAEQAGYSVGSGPKSRGLDYLGSIENHFPAEYSQAVRDTLTAYALHVRALAGDRDPSGASALYRRAGDDLGLDALAWLWPVLDDPSQRTAVARRFQNSATETAGAATFATGYGEDGYLILHSDRRSDGIILGALVSEDPTSDLIPKVVAGLLGNQTRGRWDNVQENVFILLALNEYFDTFESVTPDFVARVWLGDLYAGEHTYQGRSTDRGQTLVPMTELIDAGDTDIVVAKDGAGRLYYRLGLDYAPADLELDPRDRGFVVTRTYEAVDDPADVSRDDEGTWHIRAGAEVRVRVIMVADSRRTHVGLVDPLPAGLEPLNPALAVTPDISDDLADQGGGPGFGGEDFGFRISYPWWQWYEHQNLRDDRAEAFTTLLGGGTYDYTYIARATTPGTFVVPPAKAEEIYAPEVFGRSGSDVVVVDTP